MKAAAALTRLGGVADAQQLLRWSTRRNIRRAVRAGEIERLAQGRYALPTAGVAWRSARGLSAVLCLRSAAAHYEWAMKLVPEQPELAVRRGRSLTPDQRRGVRLVWMNLGADDLAAGVTSPLRTVIDCARRLPFDEALAIADSALRSGMVTRAELAALDVQGAGAGAVRRVLNHAEGRAANPFESVLRALCLDSGLDVVPQQAIDLGSGVIHPDLVIEGQLVVIEADSWSFHASRAAYKRDCARYNLLVLHGWRVLRFTWEQVMCEPGYVRWALHQLRRVERPQVPAPVARLA